MARRPAGGVAVALIVGPSLAFGTHARADDAATTHASDATAGHASDMTAVHEQETTRARAGNAGPLFHPEGPGAFRFRAGLGTQLDLMPKHIVETTQENTPQALLAFRLGLPAGFSVDARATSMIVANQAGIGAAWAHRFGPVSVGVADRQSVWYGTFEDDSATASAWSLVNEPSLSLGTQVKSFWLSVNGELIVVFDQHTKAQSGAELARPGARIGGTAVTFVAEDAFTWGELFAGAGIVVTAADYLPWFPYYDPRARIPYLRLLAGYAF